MGVGNWLDKGIGVFAPEWGAKRQAWRRVANQKFTYDAGKVSRRSSGWTTSAASADASIVQALPESRKRGRDAVENFPEARAILDSFVDHAVGGAGVKAQWSSPVAQTAWDNWSRSCDFDGKSDLAGIWSLCAKTIFVSGEVLIRREIVPLPDDPMERRRSPLPLRLRVLEPDMLDHQKTGETEGGGRIVAGVQFRSTGSIEGYWLHARHPGDSMSWGLASSNDSKLVPASEVIHAFRVDRPQQTRGITWLAPALMILRDLDDFLTAELWRQRNASAISVIVSNPKNAGMLGTMIAPDGDTSAGEPRPEQLEGGMISYVGDGDVHTMDPKVSPNFAAATKLFQRRIARACGSTFQHATGDLSEANYSSNRMGNVGFAATLSTFQNQLLRPQVCDRVADWFKEAAHTSTLRIPASAEVTFGFPVLPDGDPAKETNARKVAIRTGQETLAQVQRETGGDPSKMLQEIAETNAALDNLEIILDSDPRATTNAGLAVRQIDREEPIEEPQPEPNPDDEEPEEGDE